MLRTKTLGNFSLMRSDNYCCRIQIVVRTMCVEYSRVICRLKLTKSINIASLDCIWLTTCGTQTTCNRLHDFDTHNYRRILSEQAGKCSCRYIQCYAYPFRALAEVIVRFYVSRLSCLFVSSLRIFHQLNLLYGFKLDEVGCALVHGWIVNM